MYKTPPHTEPQREKVSNVKNIISHEIAIILRTFAPHLRKMHVLNWQKDIEKKLLDNRLNSYSNHNDDIFLYRELFRR